MAEAYIEDLEAENEYLRESLRTRRDQYTSIRNAVDRVTRQHFERPDPEQLEIVGRRIRNQTSARSYNRSNAVELRQSRVLRDAHSFASL